MTGTGTQADPYIVDNWTDFVTALKTDTAYIRLSADIDMNETYPQGISSTISVTAYSVNGNGFGIYNLRAKSRLFSTTNNNRCYFSNIDFLKLINDSGEFWYGHFSFQNCRFTGVLNGGIFFDSYDSFSVSRYIYLSANKNGGCFCNFALNGGYFHTSGSAGQYLFLTDSRFIFSGLLDDRTGYFKSNNCSFEGILTTKSSYFIGHKNIVNAEIKSNQSIGVDSNSHILIVNSDKVEDGAKSIYSGYTAVTTAQLSDRDYLTSIGFLTV